MARLPRSARSHARAQLIERRSRPHDRAKPRADPLITGDEPIDLYEVIRRRYERGSTIFTSNRDVEEWTPLFGDPHLASAAMDRLLHNAHVLRIEGDSYRNPGPSRRPKQASKGLAQTAK